MTNEDFQTLVINELKGIKSDIGTIKDDVSTLKSDVSTLKSDVSTLKSDVNTLKSDVNTLKSDVSTLKSDVNTLKLKVTNLEEGQARLETKIEHLASEGQKDVTAMLKLIDRKIDSLASKEDVTRIENILDVLAARTTRQEAELLGLKRAL